MPTLDGGYQQRNMNADAMGASIQENIISTQREELA
jgi:hypothetical protein